MKEDINEYGDISSSLIESRQLLIEIAKT